MPDELSPRHLLHRLILLAVPLALIAALIVSLPGLGTLRARFSAADPWLLALIAALKLCSCLSNVLAFRDVFCPSMSWRFSYRLGMAEQAVNVLLPTGGAGGLALGAWALRQGGMSTEHIGRRSVAFFVLTSIPNFACAALLGPLLLLGLFPGDVPVALTAVMTALAWICAAIAAMLPLLLGRLDRARPTEGMLGKLRLAAILVGDGIKDTGELIRTGRWQAILGAIGYLGFDVAALIVGFAAFGPVLPLGPLIFAYVIGQLGGLIPVPGGVGGTDGGLIGAFVLYGSSLSQAVAATLAYRAFQLGVPAVLGTLAFVGLRRSLNGSSTPELMCAPLAQEAASSAGERSAAWLPGQRMG
jgi:uncharacterized membrane protein YbhN (UPF0104 family)